MLTAVKMNLVDSITVIIGWVIVAAVIVVLVRLKRRNRQLEQTQSAMTAPETVHAVLNRTEHGQTLGKYFYVLYYLADDGREIRVSVPHDTYRELTRSVQVFDPNRVHNVRQSGMLTYQGDTLIAFVQDGSTQG